MARLATVGHSGLALFLLLLIAYNFFFGMALAYQNFGLLPAIGAFVVSPVWVMLLPIIVWVGTGFFGYAVWWYALMIAGTLLDNWFKKKSLEAYDDGHNQVVWGLMGYGLALGAFAVIVLGSLVVVRLA